jgi:hypothetical protein
MKFHPSRRINSINACSCKSSYIGGGIVNVVVVQIVFGEDEEGLVRRQERGYDLESIFRRRASQSLISLSKIWANISIEVSCLEVLGFPATHQPSRIRLCCIMIWQDQMIFMMERKQILKFWDQVEEF